MMKHGTEPYLMPRCRLENWVPTPGKVGRLAYQSGKASSEKSHSLPLVAPGGLPLVRGAASGVLEAQPALSHIAHIYCEKTGDGSVKNPFSFLSQNLPRTCLESALASLQLIRMHCAAFAYFLCIPFDVIFIFPSASPIPT